jgi:hypothetical protein
VLAPSDADGTWDVVEIDAEVFGLVAPASTDPHSAGAAFDTPGRALGAAYDVLTLIGEGRLPAMYEHVQESVRDFVRTLEARGYDREAAVKILLDLADRQASDPPKAPRSRKRH